MGYIKLSRRVIIITALALFIAAVALVFRGQHISNGLKRIILPELEKASGCRVIAQKIYINPFPLFIEARGMKFFDESGDRILVAERVKAYIDLSDIFSRRIGIRRLAIRGPALTAGRMRTEEIVRNVTKYIEEITDLPLTVHVRAVEIQKGTARIDDPERNEAAGAGEVGCEAIFGDMVKVKADLGKVSLKKEGWPLLSGDASANLDIKDGKIKVNRLAVSSLGSKGSARGDYAEGRGAFAAEAELLLSTIKSIFGLKKTGEGRLAASGSIDYIGKAVSVNLKVKGDFFLQTLMELLDVSEKVEGHITVNGSVRGPVENLKATGTATLRKGDLFGVEIDSLTSRVSYDGGMLDFKEGTGRLYNGSGRASARLKLPHLDYYSVDVEASDVDSLPLFKLIGWDPGIQPGKVTGTFSTAGAGFSPRGAFQYRGEASGRDVLGRIRAVSGSYALDQNILLLSGLRFGTERSEGTASGTLDIGKRSIDLDASLKTSDVSDLTMPHFGRLKGAAGFSGKITGTFDDPLISGEAYMDHPEFNGYAADKVRAGLRYSMRALNVDGLMLTGEGESLTLGGSVHFREAKSLFDFSGPQYSLQASVKDADLGKLARFFYKDFAGSGRLSTTVTVGGSDDRPVVSGEGRIISGNIRHVPFDSASFTWAYASDRLSFDKVKISRGRSMVIGRGSMGKAGDFTYAASSERLLLSDLVGRELTGEAVFTAASEGKGTFEDPDISLKAVMTEGRLRGKPVGGGEFKASVRDREILFSGGLLGGRIIMNGKGRYEGDIPWTADVELKTGRYDAIISAFLKDVPEDLLLNMNGTVHLQGTRHTMKSSAVISQLTLSMYGYAFSNDRDLELFQDGRQLTFDRVVMRSGDTSFSATGGLVFGKSYNVTIEGRSDLSPLKSLYSRVGLLKGEAEFVLGVTGDWESPQVNGGLTFKNGAFGLKDYVFRIGSMDGYIYLDNDRIVLQKLSGKVSGGDVGITGVVYLKKFSVKRFYIESVFSNITASVSPDFNVNFGGNIVYKGAPASQLITGEIGINRARYKERVEWKSWLLKAKKAEKFKGELSSLDKAELNVKVSGRENISIDNNVARASVAVDMMLKGNVYRPVLLGRIESSEGVVFFRNTQFKILRASSDFADPNRINPVMSIAAETVVKGYKVRMNLEGQLDHFTMSLASDPPLKEMDILALLTVGQTGGALKGLEGGVGAGEATSFLTGKIQDVFEERLRTITGLDRFQVDPHISKATGSVEPRVTVSKRLLGDKLFVTYSSTIGSSEEQIVRLEYYLTNNIALIGTRDERGIMGGDIRFRFDFR